jgi:protein O-GlcNAc transferase
MKIPKIIKNNKAAIRLLKPIYHKHLNNKLKNEVIKKDKLYDLSKNGCIFKLPNSNTQFFLPSYKTDHIQQHIIVQENYYEYKDLHKLVSIFQNGILKKKLNNSCICDIGANIGNHSLYFLNECNVSFVYAFEPITETYRVLCKNYEINGLTSKTNAHNVGLGETESKANIKTFDERNTGATELQINDEGNISIISLDSLNINKKIVFMKIDVEGFEISVIKGATKTINKYHPYIFVEVKEKNRNEANGILKEWGYMCERIACDNYLYY